MRPVFSHLNRLSAALWRPSGFQSRSIAVFPARWAVASASATAAQETPAAQTIKLRYYQEECIQSVLSYLDEGHKRLGISLATGAGKTVVFTQLIDRIPEPAPDATQTLILVHRRELVEQAARHCILAYPHKTVGIEMGAVHATGFADITIASVQSICSGDRMNKFDPSKFKLVLVDEAHHIVANQYIKVLEYFGLDKTPSKEDSHLPALVGVSATFSRFDGRELGSAIDYIVYHKDYLEMIDENWLTNLKLTTVHSTADISKVAVGVNGDFATSALSKAINTPKTNQITVETWKERASGRNSTLVFCVDVQHIKDLRLAFQINGIEARHVTGETPRGVRSDTLDAFRNGEFPVLLNCGVFTEGTDIPNIDCILLARPTKSRNLLTQMIGRGMRLHPGKQNCHVIDMVTALEEGVITAPTLFGLKANAVVDEATPEDMAKERDAGDITGPSNPQSRPTREFSGQLQMVEHDTIQEYLGTQSDEEAIERISRFAWVRVGDERYVMSSRNGSYLRIQPEESWGFSVQYLQKLPAFARNLGQSPSSLSPYMRPREIARADTFEHIVHGADTFAADTFELALINRSAPWRRGPATEAQVEFLNRMRPKDDQLTVDTITKGAAQNLITKMKHGGKGWMNKRQRLLDRETAKREKDELRRQQEVVRVGPVVRS